VLESQYDRYAFVFMYEEPLDVEEDGPYGPDEVVFRLGRLADIAEALNAAGWPLWLTCEGLAFTEPSGCTDDRVLEHRLSQLRIGESYHRLGPRTPEESKKAYEAINYQLARFEAREVKQGPD
jgi:hypothetical protein